MNIFSRFALRSLARNRTRTVVSIFGIALSCALICAVLTSVVSMNTMLFERTAADEGTWQMEAAGLTQDGWNKIASNERVENHTEIVELGAVEMGEDNAADYGSWLFVKTMPQNPAGTKLVTTPEITSGRAPEAPGEILLPHYLEGVELAPCGLSSTGTLELGSAVSFQLGERTLQFLGEAGSGYGVDNAGPIVGTSVAGTYFNADDVIEGYEPNLGTIDGTVVGFYRAYGFSSTRAFSGNGAYVYPEQDAVEQALADGSEATCVFSLVTMKNPQDATAFATELAEANDATEGTVTHNSLLRWQGVTGDADIWNTLYMIAAVLAVVIVVAGVSLVYNSFAISVAERTRMFGLLSSLGASKRQLRRSVLTEALLLAVVGIPVGLALGLLGCMIVFHFTGAGLASMFDVDTYGLTVRVVVSPTALALSAALALVTVLVSAWVPAIRASRVSAVDAIRQTKDVRLTRHTRRQLARANRRSKHAGGSVDTRFRGIAARLFGIPGFIAHRNLSRATSKGRVTVAALAVSVALLIVAGIIGNTLGYASGTALNTMDEVDLAVMVDATSAEASDGTLVREDGVVDAAAFQTALAALYEDARDIEGATPLGYHTSYIADVIVPASLVSNTSSQFFGTMLADGSWSGPAYVDFVDDATWRSYIEELGLSVQEFCDPAAPRAVALNQYDYSDGNTYGSYNPLKGTGDIQTFSYVRVEGMYGGGIVSDEAGEPRVWYNAPDGSEEFVPLSEGITDIDAITVGALAEHGPTGVTTHTNTLTLMLPASAIGLAHNMGIGTAGISFGTSGSGEVAAKAQEAFSQIAEAHPELDCAYNNAAQAKAQTRMMSDTIQTFIYCFTAITGLIAVANVFNTLTNSLILRRREFAVLKSIGMGDRAFRRMIAYECASYALRGFAIGFVLSCVVAVLMGNAMQQSFSTFTTSLPWPQVGISAGVVLAVILVSVAYALHRCRVASVVEALREDAI